MSFINSLPTEQEIQTIYDDIDDIIVECSHLKPIVKYTPIQNQMSIVSIKSYKEAKIETMEPLKGDTSDVLKELENDKGYHLIFKKDNVYSLFFDLDHVHNDDITCAQDILHETIEELAFYLDCPQTFIKYTESIKTDTEYSFHLSVPFFKANYSTIKYISELLQKNPLLNDYIDTGIYTNNRLFRLPNQTNEDKIDNVEEY